jgi:hypothetical protein
MEPVGRKGWGEKGTFYFSQKVEWGEKGTFYFSQKVECL